MGARVYHPGTGRFLSPDPEPGGNASAYDYCAADPVNCTDLDGRWGLLGFLGGVARIAEIAAWIPGPIGTAAGLISAGAYAATGNRRKALEMGLVAAANLVGGGAAVKIGFAVAKRGIKALRNPKLGPSVPRIYKKHAVGRKLFDARVVGAKSRLFGDVHSGARKPGLLNRGNRWAIGWSAQSTSTLGKMPKKMARARTVFRVKVAGRHKSITFGPWRG